MVVNIKLFNGANCLIYDKDIQAENETDAILKAIKNDFFEVCDCDTIKINVIEY